MSPDEVVRAQLAAWATLDTDKILSYFSDDAVLVDPIGTYRGLDAIRQTIGGYVKRMDHADIEVMNVAVNESLVMVERMDRFIFDGKITAWRDYFDMPGS